MMSTGDFGGVLGRGTAEKESSKNLGGPYRPLSVKTGYAGLKEFRRKAEVDMGVGLIYSTRSAGKPHTRGRDERNVHGTGIHDPYKQRRIAHDNTTGRCSHKGKIGQEGGIHFAGTFDHAGLSKGDVAHDEQKRCAWGRQRNDNSVCRKVRGKNASDV